MRWNQKYVFEIFKHAVSYEIINKKIFELKKMLCFIVFEKNIYAVYNFKKLTYKIVSYDFNKSFTEWWFICNGIMCSSKRLVKIK